MRAFVSQFLWGHFRQDQLKRVKRIFVDYFLQRNPDFLNSINEASKKVACHYKYNQYGLLEKVDLSYELTAEKIVELLSYSSDGDEFKIYEKILPDSVIETYRKNNQDPERFAGEERTHFIKRPIHHVFEKTVQGTLQDAWGQFTPDIGWIEQRKPLSTFSDIERFLLFITIQHHILEVFRPTLQKKCHHQMELFQGFKPFLEETGTSVSFDANPDAGLSHQILTQRSKALDEICQRLSQVAFKRANDIRQHPLLGKLSLLSPEAEALVHSLREKYQCSWATMDFGNPAATSYKTSPGNHWD